MRAFLVYNGARLGLFAVALGVLVLLGVRGLLLFALALVISGIVSYVLLSGLRDQVSQSVEGRMVRARAKVGDIRERIDEGARAEDDDGAAGDDGAASSDGAANQDSPAAGASRQP